MIAEWIAASAGRLAAAGVPSARSDARRLLAHASGTTWSSLWTRLRDDLPAPVAAAADELVERRRLGEPLAWILGSAEFCGLHLEVGPGVLCPRPETETLVDRALRLLRGVDRPVVVDVGTGSGAIALAIASLELRARVWATDLSPEATSYARANARRLGLPVTVVDGDLFAGLPQELLGAIDCVVSNPPYVPAGTPLPPDVAAEPRLAIYAGPTGSEVLEAIVVQAPSWLAPRGRIALEVGTPRQAADVRSMLRGWSSSGTAEDLTGRPRVVWAAGPP